MIYLIIPLDKTEEKYKNIEKLSEKIKNSKYKGLLSFIDKASVILLLSIMGYFVYEYFTS